MKNSLHLGKPFGIKVSIHWTFLLLIAWVVFIDIQQGLNTGQILLSILFVLTLFVCVTLHEFGHALTARRYGADVRSITLLPIGGMANIKKMPDTPKQELIMTAAGLLVNVAIAVILWGIISTTSGLNFQQMEFKAITAKNFFVMLMIVNLFIVAFNLIPAFPMDGGRMLRAALSFKMNKLKATKISKNVGQLFAILFVFFGLFINPFLVLIGIFVFFGAGAEYQVTKFTRMLREFKAKDAVITDIITLSPEDSVETAANKLVHHAENGFVIQTNGDIQGILTKDNIIKGLSSSGKSTKIKEIMTTNIEPVNSGDSLQEIFQFMEQNKYPLLPVKENGKLIGLLDQENIHKFILLQNAMV